MFTAVAVVSLIALVGSNPTFRAIEDGRIVGGHDIDISEAPYQISLLYRGRHSCGGSIIANDIILTAAHCVSGSTPSDYEVRAGSSSSREGGTTVKVSDIITHEDFSISTMDNDVALLQLETPLEFNDKISAIDMMKEDDFIEDGSVTEVTGWGHLRESGSVPQVLQMVQVPTVNSEDCNNAYMPYYKITDKMLCAGIEEGGKDACQGDSGGPLAFNGKLAGVVSWGIGCARPNYPGVYAKVSALRPWIDRQAIILRGKSILRRLK